MRWIWQQPGWPDFRYDKSALEDQELEFRLNSERLAGRFDALPTASQKDVTIDLMLSEAIKTNAIEGENLDRESVRSSDNFSQPPATIEWAQRRRRGWAQRRRRGWAQRRRRG